MKNTELKCQIMNALSYLWPLFRGSFIATIISVSWCGATQFFKLMLQNSSHFKAPSFIFIVYSSVLFLATMIIFILSDLYNRRCMNLLTLSKESGAIERNKISMNSNIVLYDRVSMSPIPLTQSNKSLGKHIKEIRKSWKNHIRSLYGLSINPKSGKTQGIRRGVGRLILFSFLWSSSWYLYLLAASSISPSELTTVYSSYVPFLYTFSWVIFHERFLASKILAMICFTTTIILITHYRGDFLNYLGQIMLVVLSSILYALFKANVQNLFEPILQSNIYQNLTFEEKSNLSKCNKCKHADSPNPIVLNDDSVTTHFNGHPKIELADNIKRCTNLCDYLSNIKTQPSSTHSVLHSFNRMLFFYVILSFINLIIFWPFAILFHFTGIEQVSYSHTKWSYLAFAAILHTTFCLFLEFAPLFTKPNAIYTGICLGVILNAGIDLYFDKLHFTLMVQLAYSFIILGFLISMIPENWYWYSNKLFRIKKINGEMDSKTWDILGPFTLETS